MATSEVSPQQKPALRPRLPTLFAGLRGYQSAFLAPDLLAGLTLAAIAIPEQMATARLGGLPPQAGFFAFIAAGVGFLVFGSNRQLSAGADSTIAPIFAGALAYLAAAGSPHYAALAAGLALLVGLIVGLAGVMRMGWIGNLLSIPVTLGFLAGIAVHIVVSQAPAALGLAPLTGPTLARIGTLVREVPHANLMAVAISAGVVVVVAGAHRLSPRLPGALLAVAGASIAASLLRLGDHGLKLLGHVSGGLPRLAAPALALEDWLRLAPLALIVALVVMVQTAATARSFPPPGGEADEDGDFTGLGAANLLAAVLGAFPVNASPPRTAIVAESGARSQAAGLFAIAVVAVLLIAGTGILAGIPEAALAGILLFVAARIVRVGQMAQIIARSPIESALIVATAAAIIVLPIANGVAVGILLSLLYGLWSSARMHVRPMRRIPGTSVWWPAGATREGETVPGVAVLAFQAPLTFLNAEMFARDMLAAIAPGGSDVRVAVLEAAGIIDIDYSAAQSLRTVVKACQEAGVVFALARLESVDAQKALTRLGLTDLIGADHVFDSVAAALDALGPKPSAAR
ncbi:MAG TPA: SulP family inorganic anion transporter [Caulobacteraceae bacterium]